MMDDTVTFDHHPITPSESVRFLGVLVDNRLTLNDHTESLVKKGNSKLFLMRQRRKLEMNQNGLKTFYCTNIRSILAYTSPVFYNFLSKTCKCRLERVQASDTKIIEPDLEYIEMLKFLDLLTPSDFINTAPKSV